MNLYDEQSTCQRIQLERDPTLGLQLFLDGMVQFTEAVEHRYHECLAVLPCLYTTPRSVFIGGGGDGLAARRLLRFASVERIVVCDYDPAMTGLAMSHPELLRLNAQALKDERVTVINTDAVRWLEEADEQFDVIICDFPDPYYPEAGPLYSAGFYRTVAEKLAPGGLMVTQTLIVPEVTRTVRATVRDVFAHEAYYRADCVNGFTLGSNAPLPAPAPVPEWTDWLSDPMMAALFALPKDAAATFDPEGVAANQGPEIVEAALADGLGRALCSEHSYRPQSAELYVTTADAEDLTAVQVEYLIRGVHRRRTELIVALAEPIANQQAPLLAELGYTRSPQPYERYVALLHE